MPKRKITPFLWFDENAEDAAKFYVKLFKDSRITGKAPGGPNGKPMTVTFELDGTEYIALNGGKYNKLNDAFSLMIDVKDQKEVDRLWAKLTSDGGKEGPCGWCVDKFGLSWQVTPSALPKLLGSKDRAGAQRALQAMLKMRKIDIAALQRAHDGE